MNISIVSGADMSIKPALHYSHLSRDTAPTERCLTVSLNFMEFVLCCVKFPLYDNMTS